MNEPTSVQYCGYELLCHATRPRAIDVPRGDYDSPQTAIEAAHAKGIEWVQHYG
jgi:hypothetical protein